MVLLSSSRQIPRKYFRLEQDYLPLFSDSLFASHPIILTRQSELLTASLNRAEIKNKQNITLALETGL